MKYDIPSWLEKQYRRILIVCTGLIIVVGIVLMQVKMIELDSGQTRSWWEIIHNVETGRGYKACNEGYVPNCRLTNQYTAIREPLPVYLFALVGRVTHDSVIAFQLVQITLVLLILLGVFQVGREVGGLSTGSLAVLIWTIYVPAMRLEVKITGDLLEGMFMVFGTLKFLHVLKRGESKDWIMFGILFGLAVLSRSAALIFVSALGFGYLVYVYMKRRNLIPVMDGWHKKATSSIIAFALVLSPWALRNWLVFGKPVIGTTLTGYVIYRHNAIVASDAPPHFVGPAEAIELIKKLSVRRPELLTPLNEVQVNHLFMEESLSLIKAHPGNYIKLSLYRFIPLWFDVGIAEQYGEQIFIWRWPMIFEQIILLIIFILGLRIDDLRLRLIGFGIFIYILAYLGVQGQLRYLVPISPEIIVIGSMGFLNGMSLRKHMVGKRQIASDS